MAGGRRRRRCHYKGCNHHEGADKSTKKCTFRVIPKDPISANIWLSYSGITHLTPKRITAFNCFICSCHFQEGNTFPDEYIEEYTDDGFCEGSHEMPVNTTKRSLEKSVQKSTVKDSPLAKTSRVDNAITPRTNIALAALLALQGNAELSGPAAEVTATPRSHVKYSPRNRLWIERGSSVRKKAKRTLELMMESSMSQIEGKGCYQLSQSYGIEDCDDLGVAPLNMFCSTPLSKPNITSNLSPLVNSSPVSNVEQHVTSDYPSQTNRETQTEVKLRRSQSIQCERSFLCYERARQRLDWDTFQFYTGLTKTMFEVLYTFLGGDEVCGSLKYRYGAKTPKREQFLGDLYPKDKLFMTLLRLRRGIPLKDLGQLFSVHHTWAGRIVFTWVRFMSLQFQLMESSMFPTGEDQNLLKPKCFEQFPNLRAIIDSSEFRIQKPKNFQHQSNTFSKYKKGNTIKFLITISCHGGLSHISEGYEGSISDRQLLVESGLLDRMLPGEAIMADRGFDAEDLFDERDLKLIMPAFLGDRQSFTARELIRNRAIAVSRVHVETFIGRIKQFRLVRYIIPNKMLPIASDLVKVCAFLANFQLPFIVYDTDDNN
ncbi:hypothetical protein FOCC_FOCC016672 [Frankliniella occidentalis]|nr:hypothetical protein FOCC_FOCC016672 [Frankliniella occidentalis]